MVDLCSPTNERYNVAVTVIMGSKMDAIVVDDSKVAADCIQLLREKKVGVATFLPLNTLRVKPIDERLRSLPHGARLLYDVISCEPHIAPAVQFACNNAVVCRNSKECKDLSFGHEAVKISVSLDGTIVRKSGPIEGGLSSVEARANRWNQKDVEELRNTRRRLEDEVW